MQAAMQQSVGLLQHMSFTLQLRSKFTQCYVATHVGTILYDPTVM